VDACLRPDDSCWVCGALEIGAGTLLSLSPPRPREHLDKPSSSRQIGPTLRRLRGIGADPTGTLGNNSSESPAGDRARRRILIRKCMWNGRSQGNAFWIQSKQSNIDASAVHGHRQHHAWAMNDRLRVHSPRQTYCTFTEMGSSNSSLPAFNILSSIFTAWRRACAVLLWCACLSVHLFCHKPVFYRNDWTDGTGFLAWMLRLTYHTLCCKEIGVGGLLKKNKDTSLCNFVPSCDLQNVVTASRSWRQQLINDGVCWPHLRRSARRGWMHIV